MQKTKRIFVDFAFFDRTGIQNFLEKQARKGWMLKSARGSLWRFERTTLKTIHYSVSYFPEAALECESLSQQQMMYLDLCEHIGWTRIETVGPMQIFYNEENLPLPIETDPLVELDTIHKATKKVYLRPRLWYLVMGLCYVLLYFLIFKIDSQKAVNDLYYLAMAINGFGLALWSIWEMLLYYSWRKKAIHAAKMDGSFVDTKSYPYVSWIIMLMWISMVFGMMITDLGKVAFYIAFAVVIYIGVFIGIRSIMNMKSEKHQTIQLVVVMLCFLVVGIFFAIIVLGAFLPMLQGI